MEFLNATAAREDIGLDMVLEPRDMQFCNNHMVLHSRTTYRRMAGARSQAPQAAPAA